MSSVFSVACALASLALAVTRSGTLLLPLLLTAAGGIVGAFFLVFSRKQLLDFKHRVRLERSHVSTLGDWSRISKTASENEQVLRLVGDLQFTITPLMAAMGEALESGNTDHAASLACTVLDECVRLAPADGIGESTPLGTSDMGLERFLWLLRYLGSDTDEGILALAYLGLTGHLSSPITFGEAANHIGLLNNVLYDIGVLRFDVKNAIDDLMNVRAMSETAERLGEMLTQPEDQEPPTPVPALVTTDETVSAVEVGPSATLGGHEDTSDLLESMRGSSGLDGPDLTSATRIVSPSEQGASPSTQTCDDPDGSGPPKRAADIVSARVRGMSGRPRVSSASPASAGEVAVSDMTVAGMKWGLGDAEE